MVSENMIAWCETHYLSVAGGVSASVAAINFSTRFLQSVTYQWLQYIFWVERKLLTFFEVEYFPIEGYLFLILLRGKQKL